MFIALTQGRCIVAFLDRIERIPGMLPEILFSE